MTIKFPLQAKGKAIFDADGNCIANIDCEVPGVTDDDEETLARLFASAPTMAKQIRDLFATLRNIRPHRLF